MKKKLSKAKKNPADDTGLNRRATRMRIGQLEMDFKKLEFMLEIQDKQIEILFDYFRKLQPKRGKGK
jgi:hypothetical protein